MNFTLRPATTDDSEWLYAVRQATMQTYVEEMFGFWDEAAQRERFLIPSELANMQIITVAERVAAAAADGEAASIDGGLALNDAQAN